MWCSAARRVAGWPAELVECDTVRLSDVVEEQLCVRYLQFELLRQLDWPEFDDQGRPGQFSPPTTADRVCYPLA